MKLKLSNYNKPSHPLFKRIGDICLVAIPLYSSILTTLPINDNSKLWILAGLSSALATVKIITKFTLDPNYKENVVENTTEVVKDPSKQ